MKNTTTSQFKDKQIMDLSSLSPPCTDFIHLMDDDHLKQRISDNGLESNKEDIFPSYDFQSIRPITAVGLSHSALRLAGSTTSTAARVLSASDFKPISTSPNRGFGPRDSTETAKVVDPNVYSTTIMSEIDRTMKKHADTLLRVMEGVSARLTQLETRTHNLENLVDDLKVSVEQSHGSTHGKMRQLETILVEVQSGVQVLKDKQDIVEAQFQLSKLQVSNVDQQQHLKTHSNPTAQLPAPVPMPQFPLTSSPQPPSLSQSPSSQLLARLPTQFSPQQEPYCSPPIHSQPNQLPYQAPPLTQSPPQYPQSSDEHPPYAMQSYLPNPPPQPSQHLYNAPQPQPQPSMYDGAGGRSNSRFPSSGYSSEPYPYTAKPPHLSSSGTSYPHALPMAAASTGTGSSSLRSESRVPIDDVIDRVTTMGFPRDQVRETVRKLTENGQAVDLNVVLDKLMNQGGGLAALVGGR